MKHIHHQHPTHPPRKLILWDIDGTLVSTGSAGEFALIEALRTRFHIDSDLRGVELAGRTDKQIAMDLLNALQIAPTHAHITMFLDGYVEALAHWLPRRQEHGCLYPGIIQALEAIATRPDLVQGLLTGNLQKGAHLKLDHYKVSHYFAFGAFADDDHDRNKLPPHAKRRAEAQTGEEFPPHRIFVIGDTPRDVACGQAIGAYTFAVATGQFTPDQLHAANPSAVFTDLSDTQAFLKKIDELSA